MNMDVRFLLWNEKKFNWKNQKNRLRNARNIVQNNL